MMRFFRLTPPSVHQMVLTLEKAGLISERVNDFDTAGLGI
jgi:DNA-binding MarR family transcriptional regulator